MEKTLGSGILGIIEKVSNHLYLKSISMVTSTYLCCIITYFLSIFITTISIAPKIEKVHRSLVETI